MVERKADNSTIESKCSKSLRKDTKVEQEKKTKNLGNLR